MSKKSATSTNPIAFTRPHPETGKPQVRHAYTPEEAVALRFDGWREKQTSKPAGEQVAQTQPAKQTNNR